MRREFRQRPLVAFLGVLGLIGVGCGSEESAPSPQAAQEEVATAELAEPSVAPLEEPESAPAEPVSVNEPEPEPEPQEEILRWVRVKDDKVYLKGEPSGKSRLFVGLARPMSPVPVYEEVEGDGCKGGKWLRVGPRSFPGYVCSTQTKKSNPPEPEPEDPEDPTKRNGFTYSIVIKDTHLYSSPGGSELVTIRPKDSYVTVAKEEIHKGETWVKVSGGWLPKKVLRPASAKGISALRGEILPEGAQLPWVFVVAKEAPVYRNPGDTEGEVATVKRYDRFPVLEVRELPDPKKPEEKRRWARIEQGWVEGKKLDWVFKQERPEGIGPNEKWIWADLEQQTLTAYEGDRPVFITIFSSGRKPNYTVTGRYTVHRIYRTHTMENAPGGTAESYYYVADIPFVMFFHKTFALHGTYWHDNFGATRSHGCVNMVPADAKWIYDWIEPQLPLGWWGMAVEEEKAKELGWTTVITDWGDKIVRAEDVMNSKASKIVEEMRALREKGELPGSQPASAPAVVPTGAAAPGGAAPASAPSGAPVNPKGTSPASEPSSAPARKPPLSPSP